MQHPETMKVYSEAWPEGAIINKADFNRDEHTTEEDKLFNELVLKVDSIGAEDVKFVAKRMGISYTTKEETVRAIQESRKLNETTSEGGK